jgi:hypothetical protein
VEDFKITPVFEFFPLHPLHLVSPVHAPPYRYPLAGQSRSLPEDEPLLATAIQLAICLGVPTTLGEHPSSLSSGNF